VIEGEMTTWQWAVCLACAAFAVVGMAMFLRAESVLISLDQDGFTVKRRSGLRRIRWAALRGSAVRLGDGVKLRVNESKLPLDELVVVRPLDGEVFGRFEKRLEERGPILPHPETVG
jgi:hypothetical protein